MEGLFPVLALVLSLSTGWGGDFVRATATVLGLEAPAAVEKPAPPDRPMTDSGCSWDPLGCPR